MRLTANNLSRGNWLIVPSDPEEQQVLRIWNDFQIATGFIKDENTDVYPKKTQDHKKNTNIANV